MDWWTVVVVAVDVLEAVEADEAGLPRTIVGAICSPIWPSNP